MSEELYNTPVLLIVFNRPDTTKKILNAISTVSPTSIFIASDGPRSWKNGEINKVQKVRELIDTEIEWKCDIKKLYRKENLGCRRSVSGAITWFFENVEEGIILEDDTLPNTSFFMFCREMLARYRNDNRIMHIGGVSTLPSDFLPDKSNYYFSKFMHIWGWASWRRAWSYYDVDMHSFPKFIEENRITNIWTQNKLQKFWVRNFKNVYENKIDTWDYQWYYTVWCQNGLAIIPDRNLVSNIGFGENATHTKDNHRKEANMKTYGMESLIHPDFVVQNMKADEYNARFLLFNPLYRRILNFVTRIIRKIGVGSNQ